MLSRCSSPWLRLRVKSLARGGISHSIVLQKQQYNATTRSLISAGNSPRNCQAHIPSHHHPLSLSDSRTAVVFIRKLPLNAMIMGQPARQHSGHGHHHHHHDNTYLVSGNKKDAGVRITRIGLYVNLAMAIGKGVGGYVFNSQSLSADAVHSLTDLLSDFMTLATVSWALKPPTETYPLGFAKVESLGSVAVSGLLVVGGLYMGMSALTDLLGTYAPTLMATLHEWHLVSCGHGHSHAIPDMKAAWIAGGSVVVKEWLYRATMKIAKEKKSTVLESNAIHHRVDSLTGIVALCTIALSNIVPSLSSFDAIGGLLISWMVIRAGLSNALLAAGQLLDRSIDTETKALASSATEKAVSKHLSEKSKILDVSGTMAGQSCQIDIEIQTSNSTSIETLHDAECKIREEVAGQVPSARRIRIRFVPPVEKVNKFADEFISQLPEKALDDAHSDHNHHSNGQPKQ